MLCPCLSSAVVSFWLLIVCIYNTLNKLFLCIFCTICPVVLSDIVQRRELILGHSAI